MYLGCGDLKNGFARIKCKECQHEVLLAFSCKGRYFCPSCHQKRVLMLGEWITEEICTPYLTGNMFLLSPKCQGEMRISFIDQAEVIIHAKRNSIAL